MTRCVRYSFFFIDENVFRILVTRRYDFHLEGPETLEKRLLYLIQYMKDVFRYTNSVFIVSATMNSITFTIEHVALC